MSRTSSSIAALALISTLLVACGGDADVTTVTTGLTTDVTTDVITDVSVTTTLEIVGSTIAAVATTLGDLLSEDEVAELEAALDDLDALLAEIDGDLADLPDP